MDPVVDKRIDFIVRCHGGLFHSFLWRHNKAVTSMLNITKLSFSCLADGVPGLLLALDLSDDSQSLVQFLVILSLTISISLFKCLVLMTSPPTDSAIWLLAIWLLDYQGLHSGLY